MYKYVSDLIGSGGRKRTAIAWKNLRNPPKVSIGLRSNLVMEGNRAKEP